MGIEYWHKLVLQKCIFKLVHIYSQLGAKIHQQKFNNPKTLCTTTQITTDSIFLSVSWGYNF